MTCDIILLDKLNMIGKLIRYLMYNMDEGIVNVNKIELSRVKSKI